MKPLSRWIGSKRWIRHRIVKIVKNNIATNGIYYEPFCGSAAVFFTLSEVGCSNKAILVDAIEPLINTYESIKHNPIRVSNHLTNIINVNPVYKNDIEKSFNKVKSDFNCINSQSLIGVRSEQAARFLYLTATCFNGIWRQNKNNEFNVPVGDQIKIKFPKRTQIISASRQLQKTQLIHSPSIKRTLEIIYRSKTGDFIFVDPPYLEAYGDYVDGSFNNNEQSHIKLADCLVECANRGVSIVTTNSLDAYNIYKKRNFDIDIIKNKQVISGLNKGRGKWYQMIASINVGTV